MSSETFLTTTQAAKHLGVSNSTIYRMVENGILTPSKTQGGHRRFDVVQLDDYLSHSGELGSLHDSSLDTAKDNSLELASERQAGVDPRNKLNDLTGSEWLPETKSFFYQKGLGSKHPHAQIERQHPAPYSYQDVEHLITFFTKRGMKVLDPFGGVGSTAKACELEGRVCTSIELSKKWHDLAIERLETEVSEGASSHHAFINDDCIAALSNLDDDSFDFMVTSPPYWSILNKKADYKVKESRLKEDLATNYSDDDPKDLANIEDYGHFLDVLVDSVFLQCARVLKPKAYMCIVVSDFRHKSEFVSFHSDLIQRMQNREIPHGGTLTLQGVKVLLQNHKSLLPYGYPFAYVENIHHQYVLIFRKMEAKKSGRKATRRA
ncbi:DNA methyltransferase [Collinsella sp. LCP19S3_B11]|uniref:helix-turn-helix domain-containing protein n=1 Tax=Collinsella sp. LCP19S3_B11 TaxID=3438754 RepID=UPI003F8EC7A1